MTVSFDGNFRPALWEAWRGDAPGLLRGIMAEADVMFASHRDIEVVLDTTFAQGSPQERFAAASAAAFEAFPNLLSVVTFPDVNFNTKTSGDDGGRRRRRA